MSEILFKGDRLRPVRVLERQYSAILQNHSDELFPDWDWFQWEPLIAPPFGGQGVRPDALLMNRHDLSWVVVEVELAHHSVSSHIEPQLERLRYGVYDRSLAATLVPYGVEVAERFKRCLEASRPSFLCVVDNYSSSISGACMQHDFGLAVCEPLRSEATGVSGVKVERVPGYLRRRRLAHSSFALTRTGRPLGMSEAAYLPMEFPLVNEIALLIASGIMIPLEVKTLQERRCIFVPYDLSSGLQGTLVLESCDPKHHIYRLDSVTH